MAARVVEIWRYPVKGLAGERLKRVAVATGEVLAQDRRFAVAHGDSGIEPTKPNWALKTSFHMLMHGGDERLAELTPSLDEASGVLTIFRQGKALACAKATDAAGQVELSAFFANYLTSRKTGAPRFMEAAGFYFGNVEDRVISLISNASVVDLSRTVGGAVDGRRFRGNFYVDGLEPWVERAWVGKTLTIGGLRFSVVDETIRCGATTVNPATSARDLNVPKILQDRYGHMFCGIYLKAMERGSVAEGGEIAISN